MIGIEGMSIGMPIFWLIAAIIFGVIEALTVGLVTIWFAGGALAALALALMGVSVPVQIVVFFVVSVGLLVSTRKVFVNKLKTGNAKNNVDELVGEEAIVLTTIKPFAPGSIKLQGKEWTAVTKDESLTIASGQVVKVIAIEGVKAIVKPQNQV